MPTHTGCATSNSSLFLVRLLRRTVLPPTCTVPLDECDKKSVGFSREDWRRRLACSCSEQASRLHHAKAGESAASRESRRASCTTRKVRLLQKLVAHKRHRGTLEGIHTQPCHLSQSVAVSSGDCGSDRAGPSVPSSDYPHAT